MASIDDLSQINEKISALEAEKADYVKKIDQQKRELEKSLETELRRLAAALGYSLVKNDGAVVSSKGKRRPAAVKYRDSEGNAWTGRGMTPKWLKVAEAGGRSRESFRV